VASLCPCYCKAGVDVAASIDLLVKGDAQHLDIVRFCDAGGIESQWHPSGIIIVEYTSNRRLQPSLTTLWNIGRGPHFFFSSALTFSPLIAFKFLFSPQLLERLTQNFQHRSAYPWRII